MLTSVCCGGATHGIALRKGQIRLRMHVGENVKQLTARVIVKKLYNVLSIECCDSLTYPPSPEHLPVYPFSISEGLI